MLGTKELRKNMKITTPRTDTHFTSRTLSVILCCRGGKCSFCEWWKSWCYHKNDRICLKRTFKDWTYFITEITSMHQSQWLRKMCEVKESKPTFFCSSWMFCSQFLSSWEICLSDTTTFKSHIRRMHRVSKNKTKKWEKYHLIETGCLFLAVYNHMLSFVQCEGFISAFPALRNLYLFAVIAMTVRKAGTEK